ncbi:MAG: hypothetical protein LBM13_02975 [Candidatus Ancillula sp.]|jgi:hypothetical protein|nr:hypothetical protein [Candidatus Ancillula sp.]
MTNNDVLLMADDGSGVFGILAGLGIFAILVYALEIAGFVFAYINVSHSLKRRINKGEEWSAANLFLFILGWGFAGAYTCGLANIIYFFVKRQEIQATNEEYKQRMNRTLQENMQNGTNGFTSNNFGPVPNPAPTGQAQNPTQNSGMQNPIQGDNNQDSANNNFGFGGPTQ